MTAASEVRLVAMGPEHAEEVLRIYQLGIDEGNATFETTAPSWEHFDATKLSGHRHVALDASGAVLGWAAAVPVSDRCVYAGDEGHAWWTDRQAVADHYDTTQPGPGTRRTSGHRTSSRSGGPPTGAVHRGAVSAHDMSHRARLRRCSAWTAQPYAAAPRRGTATPARTAQTMVRSRT